MHLLAIVVVVVVAVLQSAPLLFANCSLLSNNVDVAPSSVAFVIQYYKHPSNVGRILHSLRSIHPYNRSEILIHMDSHEESGIIAMRAVGRSLNEDSYATYDEYRQKLEAQAAAEAAAANDDDAAALRARAATLYHNEHVLRDDNVHEIRGYRRAARESTSNIICFLQDDDLMLDDTGEWLRNALLAFHRDAKLGCVGFKKGGLVPWTYDHYKLTSSRERVALLGDVPATYVIWLNVGPLCMRRAAYESIGGFDLKYSRPGEAGVGFDSDVGARLWLTGWHSALVGCRHFQARAEHVAYRLRQWNLSEEDGDEIDGCGFFRGVGGHKTREDERTRLRRLWSQRRNLRLYHSYYHKDYDAMCSEMQRLNRRELRAWNVSEYERVLDVNCYNATRPLKHGVTEDYGKDD